MWHLMKRINDNIYLVGDVSGKVGKRDHACKLPIGNYGKDKRNNNRTRLVDFFVCTWFYCNKHKDIRQYARLELIRGKQSILDYMIVDRENRMAVRSVSVKRGFETFNDHDILVAVVKENENEGSRNQKENTTIEIT